MYLGIDCDHCIRFLTYCSLVLIRTIMPCLASRITYHPIADCPLALYDAIRPGTYTCVHHSNMYLSTNLDSDSGFSFR